MPPMPPPASPPPTLQWLGSVDGCLQLIDQTLLPGEAFSSGGRIFRAAADVRVQF